jgi:hypothetical protein
MHSHGANQIENGFHAVVTRRMYTNMSRIDVRLSGSESIIADLKYAAITVDKVLTNSFLAGIHDGVVEFVIGLEVVADVLHS